MNTDNFARGGLLWKSQNFCIIEKRFTYDPARVAKLADALALGASGSNPLEVQVLSRAHNSEKSQKHIF